MHARVLLLASTKHRSNFARTCGTCTRNSFPRPERACRHFPLSNETAAHLTPATFKKPQLFFFSFFIIVFSSPFFFLFFPRERRRRRLLFGQRLCSSQGDFPVRGRRRRMMRKVCNAADRRATCLYWSKCACTSPPLSCRLLCARFLRFVSSPSLRPPHSLTAIRRTPFSYRCVCQLPCA